MAGVTATPGFFGGRFRKGGQGTADVQSPADLGRMTKDELVAEAKRRGIEVDASKAKAEILAAIEAASAA